MAIIRVKHNKENPYVMINRHSLWDENLSLEAVGLLARLLSRPDDWTVYVKELSKSCKRSEETINKLIKELVCAGYCYRVQKREADEKGKYPNRYGSWEYWIFESKRDPEENSNILSEPVFSGPMESGPTEPDLLSTDAKEVINKKIVCNAPPVASHTAISVVEKKNMNGDIVKVFLQEVFKLATLERKDWTTAEINDSWKILCDYKGLIREPMAFFEGTIRNLRNKKKANHLNKNPKETECEKKTASTSATSKVSTLADASQGRPSLQSLLEELEKNKKKS